MRAEDKAPLSPSAAAPAAGGLPPVLAVVGPTAVGKTALSLSLASHLEGEIISMDSRQVYRGMDVGTDKASAEARRRISHHGLDVVVPDQRYSAGRFGRDARRWIGQIRERGRLPLLVGGAGFFLKALTEPIFREPEMDPFRRERLRTWLARQPRPELERWVATLDPERWVVAEAGGRHRLARTLEVALLTGRPLSWWHRNAPPDSEPVPVRVVLLERPREELYRRIDDRAEAMFREGLLDEVATLLAAGYRSSHPGMTGTGYREAAAVLRGELSEEEACLRVQRATRAYARRQLTWFRHQLPPDVLRVDAREPLDQQEESVSRWWEKGIGASGTG